MNASFDTSALKSRQQTAWASGDYAVIFQEVIHRVPNDTGY